MSDEQGNKLMKLLVTGGGGYIGSHVVKILGAAGQKFKGLAS